VRTLGHASRVAAYITMPGRELGLPATRCWRFWRPPTAWR